MSGPSHMAKRAYPPGSRAWRIGRSAVGAATLTLAAVAAAPQAASRPLDRPLTLSAAATGHADTGTRTPRQADFGRRKASPEARHVADWVADSRDNGGVDFVVIDKQFARVHVFDAAARLRGSSPVLLGAARGDHSVPDIGMRPIAQVLPHERTTPAGRFVAESGRNSHGEDVVWVDYDAAVSMHRVRATNPKERRLQRLASPTAADNRISYGCINVPAAFYDSTIRPLFAERHAIVYVLPESRPAQQVFGSYPVRLPPTSAPVRAIGLSRSQ